MTKSIPWNGKTIKEPGVYRDLPIDVYHSDCCAGPSTSSSGLKQLTPPDGCPVKFWDNSYLNPNRKPQEEQKPHFDLGKAVHTLLLGEDGFNDQYAVRPKEFKDWRTNAAKDWRKSTLKAGKHVLTSEDLPRIEGMANRVVNDRDFVDHLRGEVERSVIYRDPKTGIFVKTRPDVIPADTTIADLKTTKDASARGCKRAIENLAYYMQMALAAEALRHVRGVEIQDFVLLFIETERPHAYNIKPVDHRYIDLGARQNRAALNVFHECWESGFWPTYFDSGYTCTPAEYFENKIDNEPSIPRAA